MKAKKKAESAKKAKKVQVIKRWALLFVTDNRLSYRTFDTKQEAADYGEFYRDTINVVRVEIHRVSK